MTDAETVRVVCKRCNGIGQDPMFGHGMLAPGVPELSRPQYDACHDCGGPGTVAATLAEPDADYWSIGKGHIEMLRVAGWRSTSGGEYVSTKFALDDRERRALARLESAALAAQPGDGK